MTNLFFSDRIIQRAIPKFQLYIKMQSGSFCQQFNFIKWQKPVEEFGQYSIEELTAWIAPDIRRNYDKLSVIMICLDKRAVPRQPGSLHRFLYTLLIPDVTMKEKKRILSEEYGIRMEYEMEERMNEMCNLSEAIEERGIEKGRKVGRREGRKEGRIQGERAGKREAEAKMSRLILALIRDGKETLLAQVASDDAVRERMYREYHI